MLTILLPTQNRKDFVTRALRYYAHVGLPWRIIVIDSSRAVHADHVASLIRELGGALTVEHHRFEPGISFIEKVAAALPLLNTPYVALSADDDFLVKTALKHALEYMERTPTCGVVHGEAVAFSVEGDGAYGRILDVKEYRQRSISQPSPSQRLLDHFADYTTNWYSLRRAPIFIRIWKELRARTPDNHFTELLPSALSVVFGSTFKLDELYMARQTATAKEYSAPQVWEWIRNEAFDSEHARFTHAVAELLADAEGTDVHEAERLVRRAFEPYLHRCLEGAPGRLSEFVRRYALGRSLLRATRPLRAVVRGISSGTATGAGLDSAGRYRNAMEPIRAAIMNGVEGDRVQARARARPPN